MTTSSKTDFTPLIKELALDAQSEDLSVQIAAVRSFTAYLEAARTNPDVKRAITNSVIERMQNAAASFESVIDANLMNLRLAELYGNKLGFCGKITFREPGQQLVL